MKRKKGFLYIMGVGMAMSALLASCADDESFSTSRGDVLSFSVDTLKMDTTFSNVPTPTRSFWVYNRTGKALRCQSVRLENGNQKGYRVNVDGSYLGTEAGFQTQNVEIRKGDSIRVFVELTSAMQNSEEPQLVSDNLVFALESGVEQKVNLRAFSWDAMKLNSLEVKQDQLLESTLPVVVYGGIRVDEAATLTIAPGTQLYFHENAGLQVFGSLKIEGEKDREVVMRGDRLDHMFDYLPYDRTPGQWQGIRLMSSAHDCRISFADIHSAYNAVMIEPGDATKQKLLIENATVHNNQGYGVRVDSAKVQIYNSQITNCLKHPLYVEGGDVEVNGCTIAQFYPFDGRRSTALGFQYPLPQLTVRNSLITGYHDDEVVWTPPSSSSESASGDGSSSSEGSSAEIPFNFLFDHCVLRTEKMQGDDSLKFTHVIYEDVKDTTMYGEKHFVLFDTDNLKYDFRLRKESAAIGKADPATSLPVDRNGLRRKETPDAGCYESEYENGEEE